MLLLIEPKELLRMGAFKSLDMSLGCDLNRAFEQIYGHQLIYCGFFYEHTVITVSNCDYYLVYYRSVKKK